MTDRANRVIDGHVAASSPLSPRTAFTSLSRFARALVHYRVEDAWEQDTRLLTPALQRYRRRVRDFAARELTPRAMRVDIEPHRSPGEASADIHAVLAAAGRNGLLSDLLPRPIGSADPALTLVPMHLTSALKTEELAAVDGGLMLLVCAHSLGIAPVLLGASLRQLRRVVMPAFRACERGEPQLFAFAITEPAAGSDAEEGHGAAGCTPGVVARRVDRGFVLRGRKIYISGGDLAQYVVVFAALEGEGLASWSAFLVERGTPGFEVTRTERKMGMRASGAAELAFEDAFVPDSNMVGRLRGGWALNRATLNLSRIPVAAMGVGFARAATEIALDFACRTPLGQKRLIDYQEVQLELAEMLAETQAARAMVWAAANRRRPLQRESSAAKFHCTDAALRCATRAMDLLGNHAVLHSHGVEKVFRDARLTQIFEGTNQINRLAVIEDLQEEVLARLERPHP